MFFSVCELRGRSVEKLEDDVVISRRMKCRIKRQTLPCIPLASLKLFLEDSTFLGPSS